LITVVVPSLNAASTLPDQMGALARQDYAAEWELIVVDNGSTDGTRETASMSPLHPLCTLRVVAEPRRGLNPARNAGVRAAAFDRVAICDADDVVDPGWLEAMDRGLDTWHAVGGSLEFGLLNDPRTIALRGSPGDDRISTLGREFGFLPQVMCGNVAFHKQVWAVVGGFDEDFAAGGDDVDFGWRVQRAGFSVGYRPDALIHYRLREDKAALFRQYVRDGRGSAHLYAKYRDDGMPGRPARESLARLAWLARNAYRLSRGNPQQQGQLVRVAGKQWGRIRGSFTHKVFYI
jgi:glycosyltransferase involved in cell wall biosynthesis